MAWKNLERDLASEFGSHVFVIDSGDTPIGHIGYLGVGPRELEARRISTQTKQSLASKTGLCIYCNKKQCKRIHGGNRNGTMLYCSRDCQMKHDKKCASRIKVNPAPLPVKRQQHLTEEQRVEIRSFVNGKGLGDWLANRYGISKSAISRIRNK